MPNTRIHHTGTAQTDHTMRLDDFVEFAKKVISEHRPLPGQPQAEIRFPKGFWVKYADGKEETVKPTQH